MEPVNSRYSNIPLQKQLVLPIGKIFVAVISQSLFFGVVVNPTWIPFEVLSVEITSTEYLADACNSSYALFFMLSSSPYCPFSCVFGGRNVYLRGGGSDDLPVRDTFLHWDLFRTRMRFQNMEANSNLLLCLMGATNSIDTFNVFGHTLT